MCVGTPATSRPTDQAYVWDLPTRLFHWSLVALVLAAFVSAKIGGAAMVWHGRCGLAILGLLVFRCAWGFVGSTYARFTQFVRGPAAIRSYLRGTWHAEGKLGHNPLGALSVLALLGILTLQAGTGLFANDDIAFTGYLAPLIDSKPSGQITGIHHLLEKVLLLLVAMHIGAIIFYSRVKRQNLVKPMITGLTDGKPETSARGGGVGALMFSVAVAFMMVWAASGAWLPPPPAPPPATAPDW